MLFPATTQVRMIQQSVLTAKNGVVRKFFQLSSQTLMTHPFLTKESLDRAGVELKAYARDFLRSLQRMYRTDIEKIFRNYHALLVDLHETLCKEPLGTPTYTGIPPRRIARTGAGTDRKSTRL